MYLAWQFNNKELLEKFPPLFSNVIAHHCTIAFGNKQIAQYFDMHPRAKRKAQLTAHLNVNNGRVQAVGIRHFDGASMNGFAHITISHIDGAKPYEANELSQCYSQFETSPIVLDATMKLFD
jgi:hypothetical protein